MKISRVVFAVLLMSGAYAGAQKKQSLHDQFTGQGYGMAGCGLGSVVFGQQKGMVQIFASTTNGTYSNNTFGMSSGTSNCGASGKQARANQFIEANRIALENDLARGTGEAVVALSESMGCVNTDFSTKLRQSYHVGSSSEEMSQAASNACKI